MKSEWISLFIAAVVVLLLIGLGWILDYRTKRTIEQSLSKDRPILSDSEFSTEYFSDSPEKQRIARRVRELLAERTVFDSRLMYPDDNFAEVRAFGLDSLADVEFVMSLEKEFCCKIPDEDAQNLHTLRNIVDYLDEKIKSAGA